MLNGERFDRETSAAVHTAGFKTSEEDINLPRPLILIRARRSA